jgi:HSP20 family molecular chaperone IbpA
MNEENTKKHWLKIVAIAFITFISTFLAFYIVMEIMYHRMTSPEVETKRFEKMLRHEQKIMRRIENRMMENPFEPKMRPMLVNLVKENNEYKVIIDLEPLDGNENAVNVNANDKILTVTGELDKKTFGSEKIISFNQSYYLDEDLKTDKITKEKKGNKYIVTIPFED